MVRNHYEIILNNLKQDKHPDIFPNRLSTRRWIPVVDEKNVNEATTKTQKQEIKVQDSKKRSRSQSKKRQQEQMKRISIPKNVIGHHHMKREKQGLENKN